MSNNRSYGFFSLFLVIKLCFYIIPSVFNLIKSCSFLFNRRFNLIFVCFATRWCSVDEGVGTLLANAVQYLKIKKVPV